jgi:phosphatidylglycerol:prolipoprotein diacylglycerol transferase
MLPEFHIGPFTFQGFAVAQMYAVAATAYVVWLQWERDSSEGGTVWKTAAVVGSAALFGLAGTRLWDAWRPVVLGGLVSDPRALAWSSQWIFAGLLSALAGAALVLKMTRVPLLKGLDFLAPGLALGHAIQRVGCFLSGDGCYGPPTDLPWGIAFPHGTVPTSVPVHPTMLYEATLMLGIFALLWNLRARLPLGGAFALFLGLVGTGCFLTQFLLPGPALGFGLTEAQLTALLVAPAGGVLFFRLRQRSEHRIATQAAPA